MLLVAVTVLATEYTPPKLNGDPIQVVKNLYLDLLSFKDKPDFHRLGFGVASPYNKWLTSVKSIQDKKEIVEACIQHGGAILPPHLLQLGNEYVFSKGRETKYSMFLREQFDKTFKMEKHVNVIRKSIPSDVKYSIISEHKVPNIKRSLEVRLNKKVSSHILEAIAHELKQSDKNTYKNTFILYYLPDMKIGAGAWASTHFNPDLKVKILGLTKEKETDLSKPSVEPKGKIVGQWLCEQPFMESRTTLYIQDGRIYMKDLFKDGSSMNEEMVEKKSARGRRFQKKHGDNPYGEYYLINKDGLLEFWSDNDHICTCKKLKK